MALLEAPFLMLSVGRFVSFILPDCVISLCIRAALSACLLSLEISMSENSIADNPATRH